MPLTRRLDDFFEERHRVMGSFTIDHTNMHLERKEKKRSQRLPVYAIGPAPSLPPAEKTLYCRLVGFWAAYILTFPTIQASGISIVRLRSDGSPPPAGDRFGWMRNVLKKTGIWEAPEPRARSFNGRQNYYFSVCSTGLSRLKKEPPLFEQLFWTWINTVSDPVETNFGFCFVPERWFELQAEGLPLAEAFVAAGYMEKRDSSGAPVFKFSEKSRAHMQQTDIGVSW